jgi:hypothetical protein
METTDPRPSGVLCASSPRDAFMHEKAAPTGTAVRDGLVNRSVDEDDRRSFFTALTRARHRRLRAARPTDNEVIRTLFTRRLAAAHPATLGGRWETVLQP